MKSLKNLKKDRYDAGLVEPEIHTYQGINVTRIDDDTYMYCNKNFVYSSSMIGFMLWARKNLRPSVKSTKRGRRRVNTSKTVELRPYVHYGDDDEYEKILRKALLSCNTADELRVVDHYDPVYRIPDQSYKPPICDSGCVISVVLADADFFGSVGHTRLPLIMGKTKTGIPVAKNRAMGDIGKDESHSKLFVLEEHNEESAPQYIFYLMQLGEELAQIIGGRPNLPFFFVGAAPSVKFQLTKHSGAGYIGAVCPENKSLLERFSQYTNEFLTISKSLTPKKSESAGIVVEKIYETLREVEYMFRNGEVPPDGMFGPTYNIIRPKYEYGSYVDFVDILGDIDGTTNEAKKYLNKLRLFWSNSQIETVLSYMISTPGIDVLKGGHVQAQRIQIGMSVVTGTFVGGMKALDLNPQWVTDDHRVVLEGVLAKFPELEDRVMAECDFSKFDSLISGFMILLACAFMNTFPYKEMPGDSIQEKMLRYVSSVTATQNAYKFAFIPYLYSVFYFRGRVVSGSLQTSVLGSLVQNIVRIWFIDEKITSLMKEGEYYEALLCFITRYFLYVALIYGDDRTEGMPKRVYHHIGMHEFNRWLRVKFGWNIKYITPDVEKGEEFFTTAIGKVFFARRGDFFELLDRVDSPSFCKTRACEVIIVEEDESHTSLGILPYRGADVWTKMIHSLTAQSHPIKYLGSLISLAFLCVGNLEAFCFVKRVYYYYSTSLDVTSEQIRSSLEELQDNYRKDPTLMNKLPHSLRGVILNSDITRFPSWNEIAELQSSTHLSRKYPRTYHDLINGRYGEKVKEEFFDLDDALTSFFLRLEDTVEELDGDMFSALKQQYMI